VIAIDLFCGAGGASTGIASLGFDVVGYDAWDVACATHEAAGHRTVCCDLNDWDWASTPTPDLLWASPPCQPFSAAGKQQGEADARDGMPAFVAAVEELLPPIVAMENVKGLTFAKHVWYLERCVKELERLGYAVAWRVLNAADYGVPQTRERLILIARRDGGALAWPSATHAKTPGMLGELPWVSMADALGWGMTGRPYPTIASARKSGGPDKEKVGGSAARSILYGEQEAGRWVLNTGRDWKKGGDRDDAQQIPLDEPAPAVGGVGSQWQWRMGDVRSSKGTIRSIDEPAPTLTSSMDNGNYQWTAIRPATTVAGDPRIWPPGHKTNQADLDRGHTHYGDRAGTKAIRVSVEEAAVLQGFPPGYPFGGTRTAQFQQIGNAVPPALARAVVAALIGT
jgi:DNA (cytosine-5)-methyltransferase 1